MSEDFMKKPCQHCPFRIDVKPFLHPDRAYEIALSAENPYNSFACHKTTEDVEDDYGDSDRVATENSKECAGFLTLRARETSRGIPKGFEPAWDLVYEDSWHMHDAYEEEWDRQRGKL